MRLNSFTRVISVTAALTALLAVPVLPAQAGDGSCTRLTVPVTLNGARTRITGSLCVPRRFHGGERGVDVLVHGGTYDATYWNWPVRTGRYSYVRRTTRAGRAAFAYDRPGSVAGGLPPSASLTAAGDAGVLHQIIQWLRGRRFRQVSVVAHSLGSIIAVTESGTYDDADRLVVTGMLHHLGDPSPSPFYPAALDPAFAGRVADPAYLTTMPGTRGAAFYDTATADPAVIAYDEAHKDVMSGDEAADAAAHALAPSGVNDAGRVRIPVLLVIGQEDHNYCGAANDCSTAAAVRAGEVAYYSAARSLTAQVVPGTGHSIALHPSAGRSFAGIDRWIRSH